MLKIRNKMLEVARRAFPVRYAEFNRNFLAQLYLEGQGIEIGALYNPLPVNPRKAKVSYVDRMYVEDLRKQYPELKDRTLVTVDIVANGETMDSISNESQDFVIANHFIEHCQDPILTIKNMLRVLKPGGIIFLAVPDKRFSFDHLRPTTSIDHLLQDFIKGAETSKLEHFREWSKLVCKIENEVEAEQKTQELLNMDYSIHFHVWEKKNMDEFLSYLNSKMNFGFEIQVSLRIDNSHENVYILKKF